MRLNYPVRLFCQCLNVSSSGFYDWMTRRLKPDGHRERLESFVLSAHYKARELYGAVRLHRSLINDAQSISLWRVKKIRRRLGITQTIKKNFVRTTDSKHGFPVAKNLVEQNFKEKIPNQLWLSDITYIPTREGWLYLAGLKDACTKEIVGFSIADSMHKELVIKALMNAFRHHRPPPGIVIHSDRGSQYCSHEYQDTLKHLGAICSMSRKGNCYDNAPMESFWSLLKNELNIRNPYNSKRKLLKKILNTYCFSITDNGSSQAWATNHQPYTQKALGCKQSPKPLELNCPRLTPHLTLAIQAESVQPEGHD